MALFQLRHRHGVPASFLSQEPSFPEGGSSHLPRQTEQTRNTMNHSTETKAKKGLPFTFDKAINRNLTLCGEISGEMYIEYDGPMGEESSPKCVLFRLNAPLYFKTERGSFQRIETHNVRVTGPLCFKFLDPDIFKRGATLWLKGTHIYEDIHFPNENDSFHSSDLYIETKQDEVIFLVEKLVTLH